MTITDVITGVWTTEKVRYYSYESKKGKVHVVYISETKLYRAIFTTLCGKTFNGWDMKWRRSFDTVTCSKCQKAFKKIEPSVLDIIDFKLDLDPFGRVGPIPHPITPSTCVTCGTECVGWRGIIEDDPTVNCSIWWRNRRVEKLWELRITTDHMRELTCERLQKIYEYIRLGNPIGVQKQAMFLVRLMTVMGEKSCQNGCEHNLQWSDYCGAYVCSKCGDHFRDKNGTIRFAKCFCGWNLAEGEKLEDDIGESHFDGEQWHVEY